MKTGSLTTRDQNPSFNKIPYSRKPTELTMRYDEIGHWPDTVSKEKRLTCKECGIKTATRCLKCNVSLCIMASRNCWHRKVYDHNDQIKFLS